MAAIDSTCPSGRNPSGEPGFEYKQELAGDRIYGTKEQLQRIGIASGIAFPGEPGAPKRKLRFTDPRGLAGEIECCRWKDEGIFEVFISFPGRRLENPWKPFAFGVTKNECVRWGDFFRGSPEALVAAGLLKADQLLGSPGMPKTSARFAADGSLRGGCHTSDEPGAKWLTWGSKGILELGITLTLEEQELREAALAEARCDWEDRMRSLPRPAPLIPLPGDQRTAKRKPQYRADGNVIYLASRNAGGAA